MFILALIDFAVCFNQVIYLQEELLLNPLNDLFVFATLRIVEKHLPDQFI